MQFYFIWFFAKVIAILAALDAGLAGTTTEWCIGFSILIPRTFLHSPKNIFLPQIRSLHDIKDPFHFLQAMKEKRNIDSALPAIPLD